MKQCTKCKDLKSEEDFVKRKTGKNGLGSWCKPCCNLVIINSKEKKPDRYKNYNLVYRFGITIEQYSQILEKQENKCKICKRHKNEFTKSLIVDHCHDTGKIRGLLCDNCNRGLGQFKDSIESLNSALEYLKDSITYTNDDIFINKLNTVK